VLDATGERVLPGPAEVAVLVEPSQIRRNVEIFDLDAGRGKESGLAFG
jgi:hypothetical protein